MKDEKIKKFEELVKPLIKYMAENHHPHTTLIIDSTHAELLEGLVVISTDEFLID
jgi:hypothetical protein